MLKGPSLKFEKVIRSEGTPIGLFTPLRAKLFYSDSNF